MYSYEIKIFACSKQSTFYLCQITPMRAYSQIALSNIRGRFGFMCRFIEMFVNCTREYKTSAFQTRIENIPLVRPSCAVEPLCADAGGGRFHVLLRHWTVGRPPRSRRLPSSSKARIPQSPCRP